MCLKASLSRQPYRLADMRVMAYEEMELSGSGWLIGCGVKR
jgi:hypothetical protein